MLGVDIDQSKVDSVNNNSLDIQEQGFQEMLNSALKKENFSAQTCPEEGDVFFIVVPTPVKQNNQPDLTLVESAILSIVPFLKENNTVIIESTVSQSTTLKMADLIFKRRPDLKDSLAIAYCPERVIPGNLLYELANNDRVIGGIDERSSKQAAKIYKKFVNGSLHLTDSKTAEICKLTENAYRDVQISFANELSIIADKAGIDIWELINLSNKHPRIDILSPGSGVGGHCIAVDPWFLISDFPEESKVMTQARKTNIFKTEWCIGKILENVQSFKKNTGRNPSLALMGLSYKPNIDDLRESPAELIARRMLALKDLEVFVCDPHLDVYTHCELSNYESAYSSADIIIWSVSHDQFKSIQKDEEKIELDFCGIRSQ